MVWQPIPSSIGAHPARCFGRWMAGRGSVDPGVTWWVGIEGSALFVWLMLDQPASVGELAERIRTVWPELGEISAPDVQAAIDSLVDAGLVEPVQKRLPRGRRRESGYGFG